MHEEKTRRYPQQGGMRDQQTRMIDVGLVDKLYYSAAGARAAPIDGLLLFAESGCLPDLPMPQLV